MRAQLRQVRYHPRGQRSLPRARLLALSFFVRLFSSSKQWREALRHAAHILCFPPPRRAG
jgi:hypothetical protein